jgi:hypothetical protein
MVEQSWRWQPPAIQRRRGIFDTIGEVGYEVMFALLADDNLAGHWPPEAVHCFLRVIRYMKPCRSAAAKTQHTLSQIHSYETSPRYDGGADIVRRAIESFQWRLVVRQAAADDALWRAAAADIGLDYDALSSDDSSSLDMDAMAADLGINLNESSEEEEGNHWEDT